MMLVKIEKITVGERRRKADPEYVDSLAQSIREVGVINPITINKAGELLTGLNRLEACRHLGLKEIPVREMDISGPLARLMEIDENLFRNELTVLEKAESVFDRKLIREEMHPKTGHGGDRRSEASKSSRHDDDLKRFTLETAEKMGASESTVQRLARIASKIDPEAKELIRGTALEDSQNDLLFFITFPPELQQKIARQLVEGDYNSFKQVIERMAKEDPAIKNAGEKAAGRKDPPEPPVVKTPAVTSKAGSSVDIKEEGEIDGDGEAGSGDSDDREATSLADAEEKDVSSDGDKSRGEIEEAGIPDQSGEEKTPPASEPEVEEGLTTDSQDLPVNEDSGSPDKSQEGPDKPEEDKDKEEMPEWIQRLYAAAKDGRDWECIMLVRKADGPIYRDWQRDIEKGHQVKAVMYRDKNRDDVKLAFVGTDGEIDFFVDEENAREN